MTKQLKDVSLPKIQERLAQTLLLLQGAWPREFRSQTFLRLVNNSKMVMAACPHELYRKFIMRNYTIPPIPDSGPCSCYFTLFTLSVIDSGCY